MFNFKVVALLPRLKSFKFYYLLLMKIILKIKVLNDQRFKRYVASTTQNILIIFVLNLNIMFFDSLVSLTSYIIY